MPKIIFMGTPDFAVEILNGLLKSHYEVVAIVTQPDRPVGRKRVLTAPPVKQFVEGSSIPVYQPESLANSDVVDQLIDLKADLIITAAYGQFVPKLLLEAMNGKAINVHASLLPKYRGGAPIHYAIWNGDDETGVSIMYMTPKMDAGDIIAQRSILIGQEDDVASMFDKLAIMGRDLLMEVLPKYFDNQIVATKQNPDLVTYSPVITKEQEQINWSQTSKEIDNHVRAFRPFPSTFTIMNDKRVKIWKGHVIEEANLAGMPGEIVAIRRKQEIIVSCGQGSLFAITEWQESGKKRSSIEDYLKGNNLEELIGQQFTY